MHPWRGNLKMYVPLDFFNQEAKTLTYGLVSYRLTEKNIFSQIKRTQKGTTF